MDWNRDGHLDILSGCYWTEGAQAGHVSMLAGHGNLNFDEAVDLKGANGKPLVNVLISEEDRKSADSSKQITDVICTHQFAVDYDSDGDLDIVNGCFGDKFFYFENRGTREKPELADQPELLPVGIPDHHAGPHLVDWDNDGDLDLLSGGSSGGAYISYNKGTRAEPKWSEFERLIQAGNSGEQSGVGEIVPAGSTRVWACDWNQDGWLDLLVGDSVRLSTPAEGLSPEEFEEKKAEYDRKMKELSAELSALNTERRKALEGAKNADDDAKSKVEMEFSERLQASSEAYRKHYQSRSEWISERNTGHVWLYLRKPPETGTSAGVNSRR